MEAGRPVLDKIETSRDVPTGTGRPTVRSPSRSGTLTAFRLTRTTACHTCSGVGSASRSTTREASSESSIPPSAGETCSSSCAKYSKRSSPNVRRVCERQAHVQPPQGLRMPRIASSSYSTPRGKTVNYGLYQRITHETPSHCTSVDCEDCFGSSSWGADWAGVDGNRPPGWAAFQGRGAAASSADPRELRLLRSRATRPGCSPRDPDVRARLANRPGRRHAGGVHVPRAPGQPDPGGAGRRVRGLRQRPRRPDRAYRTSRRAWTSSSRRASPAPA